MDFKKKFLLFGANGQVGWELQRSLSPLGDVIALAHCDVDLADVMAVRAAVKSAKPAAIVNAGAYTAVDRAETEPELAHAINAMAPGVMADEAKLAGIPLLHYSTDYAFDGSKPGPYVETDTANPQSAYGRSKHAGDEAIQASGARHLILRTTWVFGPRGGNFLKTMLRLAQERESLRVIDDQIGAPTSAELLADVTAHALRSLLAGGVPDGVYHCAASGETSWHGYARFIVEEAGKLGAALKASPDKVIPIPTDEYPLPATRPKNSRLDCRKLETTFGLELPHWQWHVRRTLRELIQP